MDELRHKQNSGSSPCPEGLVYSCQSNMTALSMCVSGLLHHHGQARGSIGESMQHLCSTGCDDADMPFHPVLHEC